MRIRRTPIMGFNAVDPTSGYPIRFEQTKRGKWAAVTVDVRDLCVLGYGPGLGKCRKSIRDGIAYTLEDMREAGDAIPEPEGHSVPFPY